MENEFLQGRDRLITRFDGLLGTQRSILQKLADEGREPNQREQDDLSRLEDKLESLETLLTKLGAFNGGTPAATVSTTRATSGGFLGGDSRGQIFQSFGEQLQSIIAAGMPNGRIDEKLHRVMTLAPSGMSEGAPSEGGFLVESAFSNEIFRKVHESAAVASRCKRFPIGQGANAIKLPYVVESSRATGSRWGGVRVYRAAEAATVTSSKPTFNLMNVALEKLMGICYLTDELVQDARSLEAFVTEAFTDEIAFTLDDEIISGNGTGRCLGFLNSNCLVTVSKDSGQAVDTITYSNVRKMWMRCHGRSRKNAVWFINQDCEDQLYSMHMEIGTGGAPVFMPAGGASEAPYSTLFRRPIIPIEQCSTIGTKGDIILADMSQYLLADKQMKTDTSMHVRFVYDEMTLRVVYRVNGQPMWESALTPFKGNNTLSPFVVLEDR